MIDNVPGRATPIALIGLALLGAIAALVVGARRRLALHGPATSFGEGLDSDFVARQLAARRAHGPNQP